VGRQGFSRANAGLGKTWRASTRQERGTQWKLKFWFLHLRRLPRKRCVTRGVFLRRFRALVLGGLGTLTRRVVTAGRRTGTKGNAKGLYTKRKNEALASKKVPEKLRSRAVSFTEIADDAINYVNVHCSRPADDVARLEVLKGWFLGQAAETITAHQLETKLEAARREKHWAPATVNHHHTVLSLSFRLVIAKDKVKENPARKIRRRLREALRSKPDGQSTSLSSISRRTLVCAAQICYQRLAWENVDLSLRVATIPRSKNDEPVHIPLNSSAMYALAAFMARGDGS
jgi:hypothetical protein